MSIVRHSRARRYLLRLRTDGTAQVTIPRRGSASGARAFIEKKRDGSSINWIACHPCRRQLCSGGLAVKYGFAVSWCILSCSCQARLDLAPKG